MVRFHGATDEREKLREARPGPSLVVAVAFCGSRAKVKGRAAIHEALYFGGASIPLRKASEGMCGGI